jgi:hypothetical protein
MSAGGGGTPGRRSLLGGLSSFIKRTRIVG